MWRRGHVQPQAGQGTAVGSWETRSALHLEEGPGQFLLSLSFILASTSNAFPPSWVAPGTARPRGAPHFVVRQQQARGLLRAAPSPVKKRSRHPADERGRRDPAAGPPSADSGPPAARAPPQQARPLRTTAAPPPAPALQAQRRGRCCVVPGAHGPARPGRRHGKISFSSTDAYV